MHFNYTKAVWVLGLIVKKIYIGLHKKFRNRVSQFSTLTPKGQIEVQNKGRGNCNTKGLLVKGGTKVESRQWEACQKGSMEVLEVRA